MEQILVKDIQLNEVPMLAVETTSTLPIIPNGIIIQRFERFKQKYINKGYEAAVVYADREHFSNFQYLTGIEPRFEEAVLVITKWKNYLMLGNECANLATLSPIEATVIHCPEFSLPNQPMEGYIPLNEVFESMGLKNVKTGVVGWKLFTKKHGADYGNMYSLPQFIMQPLTQVVGAQNLGNITEILINPVDGLRLFNTVHDIAYFEYGATVVSEGVTNLMNNIHDSMSELEAGSFLITKSMPISTHPMVTFNENCFSGLISPTNEQLHDGSPFNVNIGLRGGLTSRSGYAVDGKENMPEAVKDFEENLVKPYFAAAATWYENIGIGVNAGELYDCIEEILPKKKYGWTLNAGHFLGTEEWLSSSSFTGSTATYQSGQMVQADLIPSMEGYISPNMEDGIAIADEELQNQLKGLYPTTYTRIMTRKKYMEDVLGIKMKPEVLPMSNLCGIYTPYFKNWKKVFTIG